MILSELINFFSRLAESVGVSPNIFICILILSILIFISAGYIFIKLIDTGRELSAAERELDLLEQNLGLLPLEQNVTKNYPLTGNSNSNLDEYTDSLKQDDVAWDIGKISLILDGVKRHLSRKMRDFLSIKQAKTPAGIKSEQIAPSLINNSDLKTKILNLIGKTDQSISLQHLAEHLSEKYFDGNYHPILNELEQLEKDGEIEGQVITGKVFYKKKQKTARKYILRKGKNFRKYIG